MIESPREPDERRRAWHVLAGLAMGLACTIATAPFARGTSCSDVRVAWILFGLSPLLSVVPCATAARSPLATRAGAVTVAVALVMGVVNAILVWLGDQLLSARPELELIGLVALFAIPFGAVPGAGFALPLAAGTMFARRAAAAPAGAVGAGRGLLFAIGIVAGATSVFAVTEHPEYAAWPAILAVDLGLAALLIATAARDARWVVRLARMAKAPEAFEIAPGPADPAPGLLHLVVGEREPREATRLVVRRVTQGAGPYRASSAQQPLLSLDTAPADAVRGLVWRVLALLALAAVLAWCAAQTPGLALQDPPTCSFP